MTLLIDASDNVVASILFVDTGNSLRVLFFFQFTSIFFFLCTIKPMFRAFTDPLFLADYNVLSAWIFSFTSNLWCIFTYFTERKKETRQIKSPVADELATDKENVKKGEEANKKPLVEILQNCQDKSEQSKFKEAIEPVKPNTAEITDQQAKIVEQKNESNDYQQLESIVKEGDMIIDHDKKLLHVNSVKNNYLDKKMKADKLAKPMQKNNILEIKTTESKSIKTKQVPIKEILKTQDNKDKETTSNKITITELPKSKDKSEKKVEDAKGKDKGNETKKGEKDYSKGNDAASASSSQGSGDPQQYSERKLTHV